MAEAQEQALGIFADAVLKRGVLPARGARG
jgi:hypothetical protein